MVWQQIYDPLGSMWLSTLVAAIPVVMLVGLGFLHMKAHLAAAAGLASALAIAVLGLACRPTWRAKPPSWAASRVCC